MATTTPNSPLETDNRQPLIAGSPSQPSPEHFTISNSPYSTPPENLPDGELPTPTETVENLLETPAPPSPLPEKSDYGQLPTPPEAVEILEEPLAPPSPQPENSAYGQLPPPPEAVEILQEPPAPPSPLQEEKNSDGRPPPPSDVLPPLSPYTETELPPVNPILNRVSILSKQSPSLPLSPAAEEHPPENTIPNGESQPPSPPTGIEDPVESPNYGINPNPNFEPPIIKQSPSTEPAESSDFRTTPVDVKVERNTIPIGHQSPKDISAGSPQDTVEPSMGLITPPLGFPPLGFSASKPQISPWTHQETANLIQAYQEKWYSLKKGPLKAGQWEEVAITVAARCGYDEPTKTAKQCRHKIEKLRKRYRAERGRLRSKANDWNFFKLMDNLERGPLPISSSQGMTLVEYQKPSNSNGKKRKNDYNDGGGDDEFLGNRRSSRSRSSNHHIPNGDLTRNLRFADGGNRIVRGLRTPIVHKPREFYQQVDDGGAEEEEEEEEENGDGGDEEEVAIQLAAEIKGFAEKFAKMENKKIEMIRDVERYRLEMENKRMEMIRESQQMLVETVNKAFGSSHKRHKLSAN